MYQVQFHNGLPLFASNGSVAMDPSCCCGGCPTCLDIEDTLYATFTIGTDTVTINLDFQDHSCDTGFGEVPGVGNAFKYWRGSGSLYLTGYAINVYFEVIVICYCGNIYFAWNACLDQDWEPYQSYVDTCAYTDIQAMSTAGTKDDLPYLLETTPPGACTPPGVGNLEFSLSR